MGNSYIPTNTPISGSVTTTGTSTVSGNITIGNFPATQQVFATSLPMPSGASSASNQNLTNTNLTSVISTLGVTNTSLTLINNTLTAGLNINNFPATQAISATSLPLPTGGSTSSLQTTANTNLSTINTTLGAPLQQSGGSVAKAFSTTPTYSAAIYNIDPPNPAYVAFFFVLTGSATKTIRLTRIGLSGTQTTAGDKVVGAYFGSNMAGGTPATIVPASHDSTNPAATASVTAYGSGTTPAPSTTFGLRYWNLFIPTAAGNFQPTNIFETFDDGAGQGIVLRGTSQYFGLATVAPAVAGGAINAYIEWTES